MHKAHLVPHMKNRNGDGIPSSAQFPFGRIEDNFGVSGLHGCTSVIVVSETAVWISHFWEDPGFTKGQARFQQDVLKFLSRGAGDGTGSANIMPGLNQNINFLASRNPTIIIMTPRHRDGRSGNLQYPELIDQVKAQLDSVLPNIRKEVIDYVRATDTDHLENSPTGKALIQYDPSQPDCNGNQQPAIRVWVEAEQKVEKTWPANLHQKRQIPEASACRTTLSSSRTKPSASSASSKLQPSASKTWNQASSKPSPTLKTSSTISVNTSPAHTATVKSSSSAQKPPQSGKAPPPGPAATASATSSGPAASSTIHIWQSLGVELSQAQVYLHANITNEKGKVIGSDGAPLKWGQPLNITTETKPQVIVQLTPQTGLKSRKRSLRFEDRSAALDTANDSVRRDLNTSSHEQAASVKVGAPITTRPLFEKGQIEIVINKQKPFDTSSSTCHVGHWDNGGADDFFKSLLGATFLPVSPLIPSDFKSRWLIV